MGGSNAGEDPIDTAKRELKEETGLTAGKLEQIMRLHPSNSITDEEGFVFVATNLEQGETDFDDDENLQVRKLSLVDAIEMVKRNEITDAISVAALLRVVTK
jgi:8-oxo-dGTP pyrophosphatase MutT (NUDIX family)